MEEGKKPLLKDIGEKQFLSKISQYVDAPLIDFNDDASAIELPSGDLLVINVDMLVQGTDVLPGMPYLQIGKKAVTMSVSDIIAKGVTPLGCLASVGFSPEIPAAEAEIIIQGIKEQCSSYGCLFLGGDLNESKETIVDIVAFGTCNRTNFISRKGAVSGDILYSTGLFGFTALGFKMLLNGKFVEDSLRKQILESVYEPKAKIEFLDIMQELPIKICMDSSDGLLVTLTDLSILNNLGINITNIPIQPEAKEFAEKNGINPLDLVFRGGEEFDLIFAVSPDLVETVERKVEDMGLEIYKLGLFDENLKGLTITDDAFNHYEFPESGFEHFTNK
ncbi:MAG: thiamine-phosphate kinase [Candidatus Heimdallarchaeota archaeon]|nr:thiamine-phosphate kinase [Candidatus Heimdallarchaeota archaeon]